MESVVCFRKVVVGTYLTEVDSYITATHRCISCAPSIHVRKTLTLRPSLDQSKNGEPGIISGPHHITTGTEFLRNRWQGSAVTRFGSVFVNRHTASKLNRSTLVASSQGASDPTSDAVVMKLKGTNYGILPLATISLAIGRTEELMHASYRGNLIAVADH